MSNQSSPLKTIALVLVLLVLLALGFVFVKILLKAHNKPAPKLTQCTLKEEIVDFTRKTIPDLYAVLFRLDTEIGLITQEIDRLDALAKEFPLQKKIIDGEAAVLEKSRKELSNVLEEMEKEVETLYVAYQVNKKKGEALITEKKGHLIPAIQESLRSTKKETARLKIKPKKGVAEKLKDAL